ncbi:MAG: ankyrin repeat domain-containing protein [Alphaproteobacteria bacterium]
MRRRPLAALVFAALCAGAFAAPGWAQSYQRPSTGAPSPAALGRQLIVAAEAGDRQLVDKLLVNGADIVWRDGRRRTALLAATQNNHVAVARLLISRGADVNAKDDMSDSAYLLAGARGYTDILKLTLANGADVKSLNRFGGTALIPACERGHVEAVALLIAAGVAVDHVNRLGWTCLLEAVILGDGGPRHQDVVRQALAAGADPNRADRDGVTPLAHAVQRRQNEIVGLLRAKGGR